MATRAECEERIDRLERSGLDAAEFAQREGLLPAQLERWRQELRAPQVGRADAGCRAAGVAKPDPTAPLTPPAPEWIDIRLPDGGLVRLLPGLDAAAAACVLAVAAELSSRRPRDGQTCPSPQSRSGGVKK
jgi:hypothetical protein